MKRKLLGPIVSLAVLALLDTVAGWILIHDGWYRNKPVPPYDLIFVDKQRAFFEPPDPARPKFTVFDRVLGWAPRPGAVREDGSAHINSAGLRGRREYDHEKPEGVLRVAAFGDSFTFGNEVRDDDAWCHLLEQSRDDLEVLNFGVGAYGTDQAYLRYVHHAAPFELDVVLCGLMPHDALRNVNVYRPAYSHRTGVPGTKPRFELRDDGRLELIPNPARSARHLRELIRSGELVESLEEHDYWVQRAPAAYRGSPLFASSIAQVLYSKFENRRDLKALVSDPDSEPFRVTVAIVREMSRLAAERKHRFFVVILPPKPAAAKSERYWDGLTEAIRAAGIPVIDCSDALAESAKGGSLSMPRGHYSPAANAVVARVIGAALGAN